MRKQFFLRVLLCSLVTFVYVSESKASTCTSESGRKWSVIEVDPNCPAGSQNSDSRCLFPLASAGNDKTAVIGRQASGGELTVTDKDPNGNTCSATRASFCGCNQIQAADNTWSAHMDGASHAFPVTDTAAGDGARWNPVSSVTVSPSSGGLPARLLTEHIFMKRNDSSVLLPENADRFPCVDDVGVRLSIRSVCKQGTRLFRKILVAPQITKDHDDDRS